MTFAPVKWHPIKFTISAMQVPVYTKDKDTGKKVKKKDDNGFPIFDERIVPKERPRFARTPQGKTVVHSSPVTEQFEKWIRDCFFKEYPGSFAVFHKGKGKAVDEYFLGCQYINELKTCTRFRTGADFLDCQVCRYRRRNLAVNALVRIKDDRPLDLDNILKIILDAMNKVCFYDDSQFIRKHIEFVTFSKEEKIEVEMSVMLPEFIHGSLRAGYPIKKLSVSESLDYIKYLKDSGVIKDTDEAAFLSYLHRCDKRVYIQNQTIKDVT